MLIFIVFSLAVISLVISKLFCMVIHKNCKSKVCLLGKTALVTGGNSGIGYQIVLALVQRGCRVIVADKIEDPYLLENIYKQTRSRNVVFKYVDLASFSSVRELAKNIIENEGKLDILVNNAGIANASAITEDGLNMTMQINFFSAFLLTHLVEDLLKKTKGRIIFTSSVLSYFHDFSLEKLKPDDVKIDNYNFSYQNSKLCLLIVSELFAGKFKPYGVTSNTYHPGLVYTNIFSTSFRLKKSIFYCSGEKMLKYLAFFIGKTPEEGAQTALYLACANEVEDVTGQFFFETKPTFKPKLVGNKKICKQVWEATEKLVGIESNEKLNLPTL